MFTQTRTVIHVVFVLMFQACSTATADVAVRRDEPDWMNVGSCGQGLNCGPSCQLVCLKIHNYYRSLHGSPPLRCDPKLARSAQRWTDQQARKRKMYHSEWTDKYTESISWKSWGWHGMDKMEGAVPGAVRSWYSEIKHGYNYRTGKSDDGRVVGHFRAVVWKAEKGLGCGVRMVPGDGTYVTAHYGPASHAVGVTEYFKLARVNVRRRKHPERRCYMRASQREVCGENLKAPFVLPQECLANGCCYDDTFPYEPEVVNVYRSEGKKWCFNPR